MSGGAFPTADEIARAIVMACRATGDNPVLTALGQKSRARPVACAALMAAFPLARKLSVARLTGYQNVATYSGAIGMARKSTWWSDAAVDEIVGALVGDAYGEQGR